MQASTMVCPFCALLCDDLEVERAGDRLVLRRGGCPLARQRLFEPVTQAGARVRGRWATVEEALDAAAELLGRARRVLISGLGCDVAGMRAVLRLAEQLGAIVDHRASEASFANLRAMQRAGWVTATFAEVRNRADLLLFFGTDGGPQREVLERRLFAPPVTLSGDERPARRRISIGPRMQRTRAEIALPWPAEDLHLAAALLRAHINGQRLSTLRLRARTAARLEQIGEALRAARYAVIVWDAAALPAEIAELAISNLAGLLLALNRKTRAVGLPLAAYHHAITAQQVCTWQWGVPLRSAATAAGPEPDAVAFSAARLLARRQVDALLWVSAFEREPPPGGQVPTVALVAAGSAPVEAEVVFDVGIPGVDYAGTAFRMDSVVALPLAAWRPAVAPNAAELLDALSARLRPQG